jgi:hypothetical protein
VRRTSAAVAFVLLPTAIPAYRVRSFVHDGTYRANVSGGDVNGADPTEPVIEISPTDG